ncbi:MAG: hypothetical protein GYB68_00285 [Chloroflexi bacterium]|nr:hypothetical protein [Chloroflexota bacterium]
MDLNFISDPNEAPKPRDEMEITKLSVTPYPDGKRLRVEIAVTAFAPVDKPNLELQAVRQSDQHLLASLSVIETLHREMGFTMHLRGLEEKPASISVKAELYYETGSIQHSITATINLPDDIPSDT